MANCGHWTTGPTMTLPALQEVEEERVRTDARQPVGSNPYPIRKLDDGPYTNYSRVQESLLCLSLLPNSLVFLKLKAICLEINELIEG